MSKLSSAFGKKYESSLAQIRTRTFNAGGFDFKVRIPLTAELSAMQERIAKIDSEKAETKYKEMTANLISEPPIGVEVKENDVIINGKSTRELVEAVLTMENRIVEYIRLLIPVNGTMDDISYEDIESEWPLSVQLEIVDRITEAIQPGYKETRKNS